MSILIASYSHALKLNRYKPLDIMIISLPLLRNRNGMRFGQVFPCSDFTLPPQSPVPYSPYYPIPYPLPSILYPLPLPPTLYPLSSTHYPILLTPYLPPPPPPLPLLLHLTFALKKVNGLVGNIILDQGQVCSVSVCVEMQCGIGNVCGWVLTK